MGRFIRFRTELWALGQVWVVVVGSLDRVVGSFTLWADNVNSYLIFPQLGWIGDIWPFIGIMNVWLPIEWCGIDGVYK